MKPKRTNGNSSVTFNTRPMPANWENGFKGRYIPACGGKEVPVYYGDCGWTLLAFDTLTGQRCLYIFASDTFHYDIQNYI